MSPRSTATAVACAAALAAAGAQLAPASALGAHSVGTGEQIAWVRRAATNFVTAELARNGAGACGVLDAPLRVTEHHRTCAQRWDARIATLLRESGGRARLRTQERAIRTATVIVHGNSATIALPTPLISSQDRFSWSENCWMLAS